MIPEPYHVGGPVQDGSARPVVVHVPHAGTWIPPDLRAGLLVDDTELHRQVVALTDWHTDRLFDWAAEAGAWAFVNRWSRLVVDPERFADDALEPMAARGQGAVYTRTTDGRPLRAEDPVARARLLATVFEPYHAALTDLVDGVLDRFGACVIVDGHSFASVPLPSESDQDPDRPDICIGTDTQHTPEGLARGMEWAFAAAGLRVARDRPFSGALVPLRHHRRDLRVRSVMIEIRRGLYCDEATGDPLPTFPEVRTTVRRCVLAGLAAFDARLAAG